MTISWLFLRNSFRPGQAGTHRRPFCLASPLKSRSLTKWWQKYRLISHKDSRQHKFTKLSQVTVNFIVSIFTSEFVLSGFLMRYKASLRAGSLVWTGSRDRELARSMGRSEYPNKWAWSQANIRRDCCRHFVSERGFWRDAQRVCQAERSLMSPLAGTKRAS